jgi:putative alpha-1,2-mannosidase
MKKSQAYRSIFDPEMGWFRPGKRMEVVSWPETGRTTEWYGSIESNPYQQGWFVPHDVEGMVELMGGRERVLEDLTRFFELTLLISCGTTTITMRTSRFTSCRSSSTG